MSLRLRLTLLYSAILAAALLAFSILLYTTVANLTLDAAKNAASTEANSLIAAAQGHRPFLDWNRLILSTQAVAGGPMSLQIRDTTGAVIFHTPDLEASKYTLPLSDTVQQQVQGGMSVPTIVNAPGGRLLVYSTLIMIDGQPGVLQMARSLRDPDQTLATLRAVLAVGGLVMTLLACAAGWLLAGAALRPIRRITQTAQAIGDAQDFQRRVAYAGPRDEVGHLATTFNAMLARLQSAFQTQTRFVADASHELRTPLTSIRGNLGLLQRQPPIAEADRVAVLASLVGESERLNRLVNDLLTLARSDSGRPLRHDPIALTPVLDELCRQAHLLGPRHTITCSAPPDLVALGDHDALTQVLLILLDNALKFTPPGGAITITAAGDGGRVTLAVGDSGPGIAPEALPLVFERFYQGDSARTGTGTGLGLAIARALVTGQSGDLTVRSQPGQGSVFTVTLPQAPAQPSKNPAPAATPVVAGATTERPQRG